MSNTLEKKSGIFKQCCIVFSHIFESCILINATIMLCFPQLYYNIIYAKIAQIIFIIILIILIILLIMCAIIRIVRKKKSNKVFNGFKANPQILVFFGCTAFILFLYIPYETAVRYQHIRYAGAIGFLTVFSQVMTMLLVYTKERYL